jgi:hypothetical protein
MAYTERQATRSDGQNQTMEENMMVEYPPLHNPPLLLDFAFTVTDRRRKILFWNLPGCLTTQRHASFVILSARTESY